MLAIITAVGIVQALVIAVHLARVKVAAVLLGPEGVGLVGVVDQLVQLVAHLSALGLPLAAGKFLPRATSEGQDAFRATCFGLTKAVLMLGLAGALVAIAVAVASPVARGTSLAGHAGLLTLGLLGAPLLPLKDVVTHAFAALGGARPAAVLGLIYAAAVAAAVALGTLLAGIRGFFVGTLLAGMFVLAGAFSLLRRRLGRSSGEPASGVRILLRENPDILMVSLVLYAAYTSYPLTHFVSRYVILSGYGQAAAGVLQAAFDLSGALALVLGPAIALYLAPLVNRRGTVEEKAGIALDFSRSLTVVAASLAMPLVLFPRLAFAALFSSAFAQGATVAFLFVAGQCLRLLAGVVQTLLIGVNDIKAYGWLVAGGQLSFGALSLVWGRSQGLYGIALSFLVSNAAVLLLTLARLRGAHGVRPPWRLTGLVAYSLSALLLAGGLSAGAADAAAWALAAKLAICVLFALSLLALAGREQGLALVKAVAKAVKG
jgi:PST family polysaccharide transporter